ncbi:MAG: inositol monophosphatase family protein [Halobacteriales archaeon]
MRGRRLVTTERIVAIASGPGGAYLDELAAWCDEADLELVTLDVGEPVTDAHVVAGRTIGVTLGGDGTYLEGIKQFAPREVPVLGVDAGTSPFLVRIEPADMLEALEEAVSGRATIESRSQLRVRADGFDATGLNDVTIEHVRSERHVERKISNFRVFVDNAYVGTYAGDGVMISTPTGSTGLAMSAGGPLHYPRNNCTLQVTPLLVHDLSVRPIVVDEGVPIAAEADVPVELSVDGGRHVRELAPGEVVRVEVAVQAARIVHPAVETGFFEALDDRLGWNLRREDPVAPRRRGSANDDPEGLDRAHAVATEAARSVGGPLRELHGRTEQVEYKSDKYDLVTEADYQSERIITSIIEYEFPEHNVHSEEDIHHDAGSRYTWLIDPLDGTGNYANGNPNYAVSIALVDGDEPVVGVVYAPETDELFSAIEGGPAYRNAYRISTTDRDRLDESVFMSGYDPDGQFLTHFYNVTRGVRRLGSVALHLCYLAAGSCDATWEFDTAPWDTAAGVVIARAAGARLTDAAGHPYTIYAPDGERNELLGSNGPLHDAVLEHLQSHPGLAEL